MARPVFPDYPFLVTMLTDEITINIYILIGFLFNFYTKANMDTA